MKVVQEVSRKIEYSYEYVKYDNNELIMNYTFEINTTVGKPITVDIGRHATTSQMMEACVKSIEDNTVLYKNDILDIFVQDEKSNDTVSLPNDDQTVEYFVNINSKFWSNSPAKEKYKLFVIDIMYRERVDYIPDVGIQHKKKKEIKMNHDNGVVQTIKHVLFGKNI